MCPGSLTSALLSLRRAAESAARSSTRTQDLMLPPSLRSRKRPAGHLAPRRPIPRLHRASSPVSCGWPLVQGTHCQISPSVSLPISAACPSVCVCVCAHGDSHAGQTSDCVHAAVVKTLKGRRQGCCTWDRCVMQCYYTRRLQCERESPNNPPLPLQECLQMCVFFK